MRGQDGMSQVRTGLAAGTNLRLGGCLNSPQGQQWALLLRTGLVALLASAGAQQPDMDVAAFYLDPEQSLGPIFYDQVWGPAQDYP